MKISNENSRSIPVILGVCGLAVVTSLSGCGKSFLDPSKLGGYRHTPTIMPILDRIAAIEDDAGATVEYSDPLAEDLIPQPQSYRIGPGDVLRVTIYDILILGKGEEYEVAVDARGMIELPQLGRISVTGMTTEDATRKVVETIRVKGLVNEPLAQVVAVAQRQQSYTVIGSVQQPGQYQIPRADYRLLEALSAAGTFDESIKDIYIIRQVPLSEEITGALPAANAGQAPSATTQPEKPATGPDLMNLIDSVLPGTEKPKDAPNAAPKEAPKSSPGAFASSPGAQDAQPVKTEQPAEPAKPLIDLIEPDGPTPGASAGDGSSWIFLNGKWVKVKAPSASEALAAHVRPDELITQRVIKVPLKQLLEGRQSINVIVRPGDVIRFPSVTTGFVYMGGEVNRPGPYQVAPDFTLTRAITSAGGLGEIAVPDRVELTRMLPGNRQAVIRLDLAAISEHTQPDIFLKPSDHVLIGTSSWALPLAVIRNGFRSSYGFGFIIDRNLSNDIFGPPPVNQVGQ